MLLSTAKIGFTKNNSFGNGKRIEVVVTGEIQTPTGRMVFSKASNDQPPNKYEKTKAT